MAGCAQATAAYTYPRAVLLRKPAEANRANVPVRLLDLDAFVRHYVDIYDKANDDTRSILPLTRIWWPA